MRVTPAERRTAVTPSTTVSPAGRVSPRSSNLRVSREFTDHDRDVFLDEAYEYIANFFEASLRELRVRNPALDTRYRRIDAHQLEAAVYRAGKSMSACRISLGRDAFANGIAYSANPRSGVGSFNELLAVDRDAHKLSLRPLMGAYRGGDAHRTLTFEGGAEYLWSVFVGPLQR